MTLNLEKQYSLERETESGEKESGEKEMILGSGNVKAAKVYNRSLYRGSIEETDHDDKKTR